jgi:hypothetical protein
MFSFKEIHKLLFLSSYRHCILVILTKVSANITITFKINICAEMFKIFICTSKSVLTYKHVLNKHFTRKSVQRNTNTFQHIHERDSNKCNTGKILLIYCNKNKVCNLPEYSQSQYTSICHKNLFLIS